MKTWILSTTPQTKWNASTVFHAKRPWNKPQTRWHAGVDVQASKGMPILAPEDLVIVAVDRGWDGPAKATLVHTISGLSILVGCTALGSSPPVGTLVKQGQEFARVGQYAGGSSMVHFQLYDAKITPGQANSSQSWAYGSPQPAHLIDPMPYLLSMGQAPPPEPKADADGPRTDVDPCPRINGQLVCMMPDVTAWLAEADSEIKAARAKYDELKAAASAGKLTWGLFETQAEGELERAESLYSSEVAGQTAEEGLNYRVELLVESVLSAQSARKDFEASLGNAAPPPAPVPSPPTPTPKKKKQGGSAGVAVAVGVLAVIGIGAAVAIGGRS